jgi:DNA primase
VIFWLKGYSLNMDYNPLENYILLCEGQMDTIAFYTGGIANAVATLGTALTPTQACIIKSLVDTVYIAFDGDNAGQTSMYKTIENLKLNISI